MSKTENLQSNIWKYAVYLITNKRVFVAIWGAFYLTIPGSTPQTIGLIMLVSSLVGFLLEIPSGYISDKIGHKKTLIISRILLLFSSLVFVFANSVPWLVIGATSITISFSLFSGTGSAFMHETLRAMKREKEYAKIMGKIGAVGFAVPVALMVMVPFLVDISYKLPFVVSFFIDLIGLFTAIALVNPPKSTKHYKLVKNTKFIQVIKEGYALKFYGFALLSGTMTGLLYAAGAFRAPYQEYIGIPVIWFGVLFGIGRLLASLMLAYSGKIERITNIYSFYKLNIIIFALLLFILGISNSWVVIAVVFIIINAFKWGLSQVDNSYLIGIIKDSKFKATLLSVNSQINQIVTAVSGFGMGYAINVFGYQNGFLLLSIAFTLVSLLIYFYIKLRNSNA